MHTQCYSKKSAFPHACLQDWEHNQQQSQPGAAAGGGGGNAPSLLEMVGGGLRLLASQLLLLCPWFKGLASAFFSWLLIPSDVVQSAPVLRSKGHCCSVITRSPVSSRHIPVPPLNIAVLESASKSWSAGSSSDGPEMYSTMGGS